MMPLQKSTALLHKEAVRTLQQQEVQCSRAEACATSVKAEGMTICLRLPAAFKIATLHCAARCAHPISKLDAAATALTPLHFDTNLHACSTH
eukprot:14308-Heterococcus_DN1.PRE.3